MKKLSLFISLSFLYLNIFAQLQLITEWQKCLGGSNNDIGVEAHQTLDGGYIIAGRTTSNDGDVSGYKGNGDFWVVKLSSTNSIEWQRCLGGSNEEDLSSIQQTIDGGYIVAGQTNSNDGDVSGAKGDFDFWVVKLSSLGNIEWQKCLGGSGPDIAHSILQTSDEGFIVVGSTGSNDGDVIGFNGNSDFWVVKLSSSGNIEWQKCLGGTGTDIARTVNQTADGGYIVAGNTNSNDGDVSGAKGGSDFWVVKLSSSGNIEWQKCLGGTNYEEAFSIKQTTEGGYVVAGYTRSNDVDVSGNNGNNDFWVVKLSSTGNIEWQKCLGGSDTDIARSILQTIDGGYIVAGYTNTYNNGDVLGHQGYGDFWIVKLSSLGSIEWQKCLGGTNFEQALSVQQTIDGGFIIAGHTESNDGDVFGNKGLNDFWLVKLNACNTPVPIINLSNSNICLGDSVTLIASGGNTYAWSNGLGSNSEIKVAPLSTVTYEVTVTSLLGCTATVSESVGVRLPFSDEEICLVTVDSLTGYNEIVWEKTLGMNTAFFKIYKQNNFNSQYDDIGLIHVDSLSVFIDSSSNSVQKNSSYKISVVDSCGNESLLSDNHTTIHLSANQGTNGEINLQWNPYVGFSYNNFEIYRSNNVNSFILIGMVANSSFSYTDLTPPLGTNHYLISVSNSSGCSPSRSIFNSISNVVETTDNLVGLFDENYKLKVEIYPNPTQNNFILSIESSLLQASPPKAMLYDIQGRLIEDLFIYERETKLDLNGYKNGIYLIRVQTETESINKKLLKQ